MGLLDAIGAQDASYLPFLNTGTLFDLVLGQYVPGIDNHFVLNGGLAATNGVMGTPQMFKSTLALALTVNTMARYPLSTTYVNDSDFALGDKRRILEMLNLYHDDPIERARVLATMEEDFRITNSSEHDLESFIDKIKEIDVFKTKNRKDFLVEIPMLDHRTNKAQQMMIPTFVVVDTWTSALVKSAMDVLDKHAASSSDTNTLFMRTGLVKTKIMTQLPIIAVRSGIYFILTAHVGNKVDMSGSYGPPPKDMQYMKQGQALKGVGSEYLRLVSNLIESRSATVLFDKDKECEYPLPSGITGPTEMSTIDAVVVRCKNNNSGAKFSPVMSQSRGLETELSNYHYLRKNDYFGLTGNNINHQPALLPEVTLSRTKASTKLMDYKTARAVELLAQLCYVQNNWTVRDDTKLFQMTPTELTEGLVKCSGYAMDDILNSRGWWSYGDQPRSYLSLLDVLDIASGNYKPKLHAVTVPSADKKK